MRQLTSLDAQFLALETPRNFGHTAGVAILDPSTAPGGRLGLGEIQQLILERLPLLPPFRWKLAEVPLALDYPYWVDDPHFDIDFHVRELALVEPGTMEKLEEQVARIFARPLDRARPLWELYLIHGLEHGRLAMMTKTHHAVIDGMSGAEILGVLLDLTPEGREVPQPARSNGSRVPTETEMLVRGVLGLPRYPLRMLRSLPAALPNIDEVGIYGALPGAGLVAGAARALQRVLTRERTVSGRHLPTPPHTSFNGRVSAQRRVTFGHISLDEVKVVKNAHDVTVNDVIVSISAGAVRRWLQKHGELPEEPLVAQIPVSVRSQEQQGTFGNRILLMSAPLHTEVSDPTVRLHTTHESLAEMKQRHRALPATLLQDANHFIPPAVFSRAARLTFAMASNRRLRPTWNLVISNVPGPQLTLYCAGARLEALYPVSVVTDGMGLNITVMSYDGQCNFGLIADRDMIPDLPELMDWLYDELGALTPAAAPARPRRRSTATAASRTRTRRGSRRASES